MLQRHVGFLQRRDGTLKTGLVADFPARCHIGVARSGSHCDAELALVHLDVQTAIGRGLGHHPENALRVGRPSSELGAFGHYIGQPADVDHC